MLTRTFTRQLHRAQVLLKEIPDNSPRVADNEDWLNHLQKRRPYRSKIPQSLHSDELTGELTGPETFPYIIDAQPTKLNPYYEMRVPVSNFQTKSSPFSHLSYKQRPKQTSSQNFSDLKIVKCRSGPGGAGAISFFRDAGRAKGPPDGGDGGDGGGVYIQAMPGISSLHKLRQSYIAKDGCAGASKQLDGSKGDDILITVPIGTVVKWCIDPKLAEDGQEFVKVFGKGDFQGDCEPTMIQMVRPQDEKTWIFKGKDEEYHLEKDWFQQLTKKMETYETDLINEEMQNDTFPLLGLDLHVPSKKPICLLKGGKGGLGNMHFLTNEIRNPRFAKKGRPGLESYFILELKSLADLGLVGLPNAGKSTILNRISNAKPKIGHWEFTTLHPTIGTISMGIDQPSFTVADIPGIIKDASKNKGMGLEFLRHIERSNGLVFVLSLENANPLDDLDTLITELGGLEKISGKNMLIVCNKADVEGSFDKYKLVEEYTKANGWAIIPISAKNNENIDTLVSMMAQCAKA